MTTYSAMLSDIPQSVCETTSEYQYLTERHLQAMWFEQKYFRNLVTASGEPIKIISPGIWNAEAGPDFLKAHFKIGNREFRGDVEIHFVDENWQQHQHHLDDRYNQVVLHVALWKPKHPKKILTNNGQEIILAHLEDFLTLSHTRIVQLIDLDLYPYKKFIGSGRCARTLFKTLPEEKISSLFKHAAEWRLAQKLSYLQVHSEKPGMQLGLGIAMALGYKNNAEAFLNLFLLLKDQNHTHEKERLAFALKACGFFQDYFVKKWKGSTYYNELSQIALTMNISDPIKLVLNQIRPFNHPVRRIAYLAKLLSEHNLEDIYNQLIALWKDHWSVCKKKKDWNDLVQAFCNLIPDCNGAYWNHHYTFEETEKKEILPMIGEDLKKEMLVNTVLPLLQSDINKRNDCMELNAFSNFYLAFPASKTSKTRYLIHRFFGESPKGNLLNRAYTEQGAYQVHKDFCINFESSCEGCPFVDRYKNTFG